jgi:predicted HAD superfamily Cof-like phosphohydrolase
MGCVARSQPDYYGYVREFHERFDIPAPAYPTGVIPDELQASRIALMREELEELLSAMESGDIVEIADGLADLLYVVFGTAAAYGIPMDEVFGEVHRSNMSKLGPEGRALIGEHGKRLKGPDYRPPNLAPLLD